MGEATARAPKAPTTPHVGSKHPKKPREGGQHFQGVQNTLWGTDGH